LNSVARELTLFKNMNIIQIDTFEFPKELVDFVIRQAVDKKLCEENDQIILI